MTASFGRWRLAALAGIALAGTGAKAAPARGSTPGNTGQPSFPRLTASAIGAPGGPEARDPVLARDADGRVWLAWADEAGPRPNSTGTAVRCAALGSDGRWHAPLTVAGAADLDPVGMGPLGFAAGEGRTLAASWRLRGGAVVFALSSDRGKTWSAPAGLNAGPAASPPLHSPPSVCTLADGRLLAVWTRRRGALVGLYTRFLTGPYARAPEWLLAHSVDPDTAPQVEPLLDGGALVAAAIGPARSLHLLRLDGRRWRDEGAIAGGATMAGGAPRLAADGGRVVVVWVDGRTADPQELPPGLTAAFSPDAGQRFLQPLPLPQASPGASPDVALLHDGSSLVVWNDGGVVRLARLSPSFYVDPPQIMAVGGAQASGHPTISMERDYTGGAGPATALVVYPSPVGLRAFTVAVPEGALLAASSGNCQCTPTPEELLGYPVRATVVALAPSAGKVRMQVDEAPGVLHRGQYSFACDAATLRGLRTGAQCLARIRREGTAWRVFDLRRLGP